MQRNTSNIQFYCRDSKTNKQGLAHIEMSANINGERRFLNLPMMVKPADFNRKRPSKEIVDYCDLMRSRVNEIMTEMLRHNEPLTTEALLQYIRTGGYKVKTIESVFNEFLALYKDRVGVSLSQTAYHKYEAVSAMFMTIVKGDREFSTINTADVIAFRTYIEGKYEKSSCAGYLTKVKTIIKFGQAQGYITTDPFNSVKIHKCIKDVYTISDAELDKIGKEQFVSGNTQHIADLFVFACGSGLAYCDCQELQPSDFVEQDGHMCIFKERRKTGVKYYSVLLPCAVEIAKKYNYDFGSMKISNQKTNQHLKVVQDTCNITSVPSLHFHLARHYYATKLLSSGVPITTVSKCLGHKGIQMSSHYAKVMERTVINDVSAAFSK